MSPEQEDHLYSIIQSFCQEVDEKYRSGQAEHGGNLWEKPGLLQMLKEELVDAYVYICTLEQQMYNNNLDKDIRNDL